MASGTVEREGIAALSEISATLGKVERVTLLLAASDVTLLRLKVPPLSPTRLKAALPNLVEEHLICDPAECVIVAGASADGMRTVAIVQRAWLETIAKAVTADGVRSVFAVPAQLCLPCSPGTVSAAIDPRADELQLTVRLSEQEGLGVAMPPGSSARDVLDTVSAVARDAPLVLHVPDTSMDAYRGAMDAVPGLASRADLVREDWSCWLDGADSAGPNMLSGLTVRYAGQDRWRQWRWPMALAAGVVGINLVGLYTDWWRMKSESDRLRAGMVQTFKSGYPNESVILDPTAQMKQKIAASRRASGQFASDDFLVLVSGFGEAWARVAPARPNRQGAQIAGLEFRNHSLLVRPQADAELPGGKLAEELKARGLSLSQPTAGAWQVRSIK